MSLKTKFNLAMLGAFSVGLLLAAVFLHRVANDQAREEVLREASLMMSAASAVRTYTATEIRPLLAEQSELRFLPHTVPSWAAQTNMRTQLEQLPSYSYKEASLNPTNPADRATDWEADIIGAFTRDQELTEFVAPANRRWGRPCRCPSPFGLRTRVAWSATRRRRPRQRR